MRLKQLILTSLACLLIGPLGAFAAGTCTVTKSAGDAGAQPAAVIEYTIAWVADAADGSVPTTCDINPGKPYQWYLFEYIVDPGSPSPTADYDIQLVDENGYDASNGDLMNLSATVTLDGGFSHPTALTGPVTFTLTNNSVNSAQGTLRVKVVR